MVVLPCEYITYGGPERPAARVRFEGVEVVGRIGPLRAVAVPRLLAAIADAAGIARVTRFEGGLLRGGGILMMLPLDGLA